MYNKKDIKDNGLIKDDVYYKDLFENASEGMVVMNKEGIVLDVNKKFCNTHGYDKDELLGSHYEIFENNDTRGDRNNRINNLLNCEQRESVLYETVHNRKDGQRIYLESSSIAISKDGKTYIQSIHRDIEERKRMYEKMLLSQNLESLGVLASGIAHEFNNIFSSILGYVECLYDDLPPEKARKMISSINKLALRGSGTASSLQIFSKRNTKDLFTLNINDIIRDTVNLAKNIISSKKVSISINLNDELNSIKGEPMHLEQMLMILINNAINSIPYGQEGTVYIATSNHIVTEPSKTNPELTKGQYVFLAISDTGYGMPEETLNRIFEPFYEVKSKDKGLSLGLFAVYGIVRNHKGLIKVKSKLGQGTTFEIYIPALETVSHKEKGLSHEIINLEGTETILLVDDEPDILSSLGPLLEKRGYKVIATDDPKKAIELYNFLSNEIDLVISDIVMPQVSGRDLIWYFKKIRPECKVIAITAQDLSSLDMQDYADVVVKKPYITKELLTHIRKVLGRR